MPLDWMGHLAKLDFSSWIYPFTVTAIALCYDEVSFLDFHPYFRTSYLDSNSLVVFGALR